MSDEKVDIAKKYWFTNQQVVGLVTFAVMATFTLTTIYWRFILLEEEVKWTKERTEYVDIRHDRKLENLKQWIRGEFDRLHKPEEESK